MSKVSLCPLDIISLSCLPKMMDPLCTRSSTSAATWSLQFSFSFSVAELSFFLLSGGKSGLQSSFSYSLMASLESGQINFSLLSNGKSGLWLLWDCDAKIGEKSFSTFGKSLLSPSHLRKHGIWTLPCGRSSESCLLQLCEPFTLLFVSRIVNTQRIFSWGYARLLPRSWQLLQRRDPWHC